MQEDGNQEAELAEFEPDMSSEMLSQDEDAPMFNYEVDSCILDKWTDSLVTLTGLERTNSIKAAYTALIATIDRQEEMRSRIAFLKEFVPVVPLCGTPEDLFTETV